MRNRILTVGLLLLVVLSLASCGGRRTRRGAIEIVNSDLSIRAIDGVEADRLFSFDIFVFSDFITPGNSVAYFVPAGVYDVTVFWDLGGQDTFFGVDVYSGGTSFVNAQF